MINIIVRDLKIIIRDAEIFYNCISRRRDRIRSKIIYRSVNFIYIRPRACNFFRK